MLAVGGKKSERPCPTPSRRVAPSSYSPLFVQDIESHLPYLQAVTYILNTTTRHAVVTAPGYIKSHTITFCKT
jgi:hypothetical protein